MESFGFLARLWDYCYVKFQIGLIYLIRSDPVRAFVQAFPGCWVRVLGVRNMFADGCDAAAQVGGIVVRIASRVGELRVPSQTG